MEYGACACVPPHVVPNYAYAAHTIYIEILEIKIFQEHTVIVVLTDGVLVADTQ